MLLDVINLVIIIWLDHTDRNLALRSQLWNIKDRYMMKMMQLCYPKQRQSAAMNLKGKHLFVSSLLSDLVMVHICIC